MQSIETNIASGDYPFGYIKDGKIFLKPFLHFPERQIGEVRESEEYTVHYFENRFEQFEKKINAIFSAIEQAENKGSYLQKLLHLKQLIGTFDALGDFTGLYHMLLEKEKFLNEIIAQNRIKNLAQKKALLDELSQFRTSNDWINVAEKIKEIKNKWIRIGNVEKELETEIEGGFQQEIDNFFKRRQEFFEERDQINKLKLKKYELLAAKAEMLRDSLDVRKTIDEFKKLNEDWKAVGPVPKRDLLPIQKKFKDATSFFFRRIKQQRRPPAAPGTPQFSNSKYEKFENMIRDVERILAELPPYGDDNVRKMVEEWRRSMPARSDDFKKLDQKFKTVCTRVLDIYFVNKITAKKNPNFKTLSAKEQLKLKIGVLKELIARDSEQIENFENSFAKQEVNAGPNSYDKVFGAKLYSQKRNLEAKKNLLREMEERLLIMA